MNIENTQSGDAPDGDISLFGDFSGFGAMELSSTPRPGSEGHPLLTDREVPLPQGTSFPSRLHAWLDGEAVDLEQLRAESPKAPMSPMGPKSPSALPGWVLSMFTRTSPRAGPGAPRAHGARAS